MKKTTLMIAKVENFLSQGEIWGVSKSRNETAKQMKWKPHPNVPHKHVTAHIFSCVV